jgi:beta-mannosidase
VETLEDLVYYSQLNQRDALRCGIEHYLMSEFCAGTLVWQFNDCWPAQSWAVQDSERNVKPPGHELARLYAVWCSTTRITEDLLEVFFRSNLPEGWDRSPQLTFSILGLSGETLLSHQQELSLPFGEFRAKIAQFDLSLVDRARAVFVSEIDAYDRLMKPRSARLLCEPKEFTQEAGRLVVSTASKVVRQLSSDQVLVDFVLYDPDFRASSYYQFFPVYVPGAPFVLSLDYEPKRLVARSLAGYHEVEISRGPL